MSWCAKFGQICAGSWTCAECKITSTGADNYCRYRIMGGCPWTKAAGRLADNRPGGSDASRVKLIVEASKAAGYEKIQSPASGVLEPRSKRGV